MATPVALLASSLTGFLAGCGGGGALPSGSGSGEGTILPQPDPTIGSNTFVVDANSSGHAGSLQIRQVSWGRLVNVRDSSGALQNTDMVVGDDIHSDSQDFEMTVNPFTEETTVRILHLAGTPEYVDAFRRLDQFLTPVLDKSLDPGELPPFTLLPRNAALLIKFNDLLDLATIHSVNMRIVVGYPAESPFDYRIVQDRNHGDLVDANGDGTPEFHTTRVILDTTVSSIEAQSSNPPLPINNLGLPASINTSQANVGVRIPTNRDPGSGQTTLLTNLDGNGLSFSNNGSNDNNATHDIVRAMRSGGGSAGSSVDPNNGFLVDDIPPSIVGVQAISISTPTGIPDDYITNVDYVLDACATQPKVGDVIQQPGVFAEITHADNLPTGGTVMDVHFRVVFPINGTLQPGPAQIFTHWDSVIDFGKQGCFVSYQPGIPPGGSAPGTGVASNVRVVVRFSEPMDPATLTAFDNMPVLRVDPANNTPTARDYVIGDVVSSADLRQYTFIPVINYRHTFGNSNDRYWVKVQSGASGPVDLAGNPIADALPAVPFTIDPTASTENNASLVFRFSSADEIGNDTFPEWRGQIAPDFLDGRIGPRPVGRLRATCDRTVPIPGIMPTFPVGLQTPLSGLGSKMQTLWRYCDVGYALLDEATYNMDVEHLYWAPAGGNVVADTFDLFEIRLCHSKFLPDETVNPTTVLPQFPSSGLVETYNSNLLDALNDPQRIVHPKALGYVVNPADKKLANTGAEQIMPYPLNWGIPITDYQYFTWRDTSVLSKGGNSGPGAELPIVCATIFGLGTACNGCPYTGSTVPTLGLPLLMEFRCYPDSGALGLNALDVNFAVNSSSRPNFRAFSTGGTNTSGIQVHIDPDNEPIARGGFNPTSNPPGLPTLFFDNTLYLGEMDLVMRISRAHSIWLDTQMTSPTYLPPVIEPRATDQPAGTSIVLHFRGATAISPPNAPIMTSATFIDPFGDTAFCPSQTGCNLVPCTATNGLPTLFMPGSFQNVPWRSSITDLNTAKLFQVRVTFVSNTNTNLSPSLSALGFAFRQ